MYLRWTFLLIVSCLVTALIPATTASAQETGTEGLNERYVGAWAASSQPPYNTDTSQDGFNDQTVRNIVHTSAGGSQLRIRVSNVFGEQPLEVGAAAVATQEAGAATIPDSSTGLTFGGSPSVEIPAGEEVYSDPTAFEFAPGQNLAVSLYLPEATGPTTWHALGQQLTYISTPGDHTADVKDTAFAFGETSSFFLTRVDAVGAAESGTVVAVGDSITDGYGSTLNGNARYPDYLAERMLAAGVDKSLLNAGISGNRILTDSPYYGVRALDRLERDVFSQSGVTDIILLEGINDIGHSQSTNPQDKPAPERSADEIIEGMREVIDRAHAEGIRVYGGTLLPFEGADYYYEAGEEKRQAVNDFIRHSGEFDGVIDFDKALRDPEHPTRLLPAYDSGDHLHPNDAGYRAMAEAVDLTLLASPAQQKSVQQMPETGGFSIPAALSAALLLGSSIIGFALVFLRRSLRSGSGT